MGKAPGEWEGIVRPWSERAQERGVNLESREVRGGEGSFDFTVLWQRKGKGVQGWESAV